MGPFVPRKCMNKNLRYYIVVIFRFSAVKLRINETLSYHKNCRLQTYLFSSSKRIYLV